MLRVNVRLRADRSHAYDDYYDYDYYGYDYDVEHAIKMSMLRLITSKCSDTAQSKVNSTLTRQ